MVIIVSKYIVFAGIADALWINIYPFVRDHAMTLTPLPQLADLAAALCLLGLKL